MGAYSEIRAFDSRRHREQVAPALIALLDQGELTPLLQPLYAQVLNRAEAGIQAHAAFYRERAHPAASLLALRQGLGIVPGGNCRQLDAALAARPDAPVDLLDLRPGINGGCAARECPLRADCPLYGPNGRNAEAVMDLFQAAVAGSVRGEGRVLGKRFTLSALVDAFARQQGQEDDAEGCFGLDETETPQLLARLCRRAAIWGWGDGGSGEGLLGWLDPEETRQLAQAPLPPTEADGPDFDALRTFAAACAAKDLGLLLQRR